jgi:histidyl-tRNA synthetase
MRIENSLPPKGMRDIEPLFAEVREQAVTRIVETYKKNGFHLIETPAMEKLENLVGQKGGENEKLIFKILRRGLQLDPATPPQENDLVDYGLRYDLTVPLSRYYANNQENLPKPFKVFQIGPVWRAERPQKSRYRQFTQCDIDILGDASCRAEIELITVTCKTLSRLGLTDFEVRINDRRILEKMGNHCALEKERYREFLIAMDKLDKKSPNEILFELEKKGFSKETLKSIDGTFQVLLASQGRMETVMDFLGINTDWEVTAELRKIMDAVKAFPGLPCSIRFDPTLVRGMDYYTGAIFEINKISQNTSIAGGGRYDKMIGGFLGTDVPACGFSLGFERIVDDLLKTANIADFVGSRRTVLFYSEERDEFSKVIACAEKMREDGSSVSMMPRQRNFANQLTKLEAVGFGFYSVYSEGKREILPISAAKFVSDKG